MSTLILTCNTGEGHNSCAKAIKEVYDARATPCVIKDALGFVSEDFSAFVKKVHISVYQDHPRVFSSGYTYVENHIEQTIGERTIPYRILSSGSKQLYRYIVQNHFSNIICTHSMISLMLSAMQKEYPVSCRTAFVATDYTCSPGVKSSTPQLCFIPDASLEREFYCENIHPNQIIPSGIPVRQQFYSRRDKLSAKEQFRVPFDKPHLLLMCGSMGCGPIEQILQQLSSQNSFSVSVVCGNNADMERSLKNKYAAFPQIHIHGFVQEMPLLMDSADAILTKPGGLSSTEAAVKCIPMVMINAVAGCESYNLRFFCQRGGAICGDTAEDAAELCRMLMCNPQKRMEMADALQRLQIPNAASIIYDCMESSSISLLKAKTI